MKHYLKLETIKKKKIPDVFQFERKATTLFMFLTISGYLKLPRDIR
jgi:hypothetical protein